MVQTVTITIVPGTNRKCLLLTSCCRYHSSWEQRCGLVRRFMCVTLMVMASVCLADIIILVFFSVADMHSTIQLRYCFSYSTSKFFYISCHFSHNNMFAIWNTHHIYRKKEMYDILDYEKIMGRMRATRKWIQNIMIPSWWLTAVYIHKSYTLNINR